jgi:hypothetical protein
LILSASSDTLVSLSLAPFTPPNFMQVLDPYILSVIAAFVLENQAETGERQYESVYEEERYTQQVLHSAESRFRKNMLMSRATYHALHKYIINNTDLTESRYISTNQQIAIFFAVVSKKKSKEVTCEDFRHSGQTVSHYFHKTLQLFLELASLNIYLPDPYTVPPQIAENESWAPYLYNCMGAIDGSKFRAKIAQ